MRLSLALGSALAVLPAVTLASNLTFTSEAAFDAAAGATVLESFETLTTRVRTTATPIVTPLFSLSSPLAGLGVLDGPLSPQDGFGAFATDGVKYVSAYRANQPLGTLTFDLSAPALAFGFDLTDIEVSGALISISTDTGFFSGGVTLETVSSNNANGSLRFFGFTQDLAFSRVSLTITGFDEAVGLDAVKIAAAPVPLPTTALVLGSGLVALGSLRRRRQAQGAA